MPLLSWSYWFDLQARELLPVYKIAALAGFGALFLAGIVVAVLASRNSDRLAWAEGGRRFGSIGIWMGLLGLFLVLCTHELVYFFGARFWYPVWLVLFLILFIRWLKFMLVDLQEKKIAYDAQARIEKWIPQHKK